MNDRIVSIVGGVGEINGCEVVSSHLKKTKHDVDRDSTTKARFKTLTLLKVPRCGLV
jgi:hypothetical protein